MQMYLIVSRYIHNPPIVERRVKHRNRVILCHIDLVKDSKTAVYRALIHRTRPQLHFTAAKCICAHKRAAVHVDMKGHVVGRSAEHPRKIFRQNIFSGRLRAGQQDILALQQRVGRHLKCFSSIIRHVRGGDSVLQSFLHRIMCPESSYFL